MAVTGALSPTRALRRSRHLDGRALVGVLLTLLAVGGGMVVFNAASDSRGVLVATRGLPAVAGHIRPNDAVTVLATFDKGKPDSKTSVVLPRVRVYDVGYDQSAPVVNTGGSAGATAASQGQITTVTLILDNPKQQESQLAQAKWNADLDVVLLPPSAAGDAAGQAQSGQ